MRAVVQRVAEAGVSIDGREVAAIDAGTPVKVDPTIRERFRQSSRTAAMVEIYDRVIAG